MVFLQPGLSFALQTFIPNNTQTLYTHTHIHVLNHVWVQVIKSIINFRWHKQLEKNTYTLIMWHTHIHTRKHIPHWINDFDDNLISENVSVSLKNFHLHYYMQIFIYICENKTTPLASKTYYIYSLSTRKSFFSTNKFTQFTNSLYTLIGWYNITFLRMQTQHSSS